TLVLELAGRFAVPALVAFRPGNRHHWVVLLAGHGAIGRHHSFQYLPEDQRLRIAGQRQANAVDVGWSPDVAVLDAVENRVVLRVFGEEAARALLAVLALVADPGLAEHLPAEAAVPRLAVPGVLGE